MSISSRAKYGNRSGSNGHDCCDGGASGGGKNGSVSGGKGIERGATTPHVKQPTLRSESGRGRSGGDNAGGGRVDGDGSSGCGWGVMKK